MAIKFFNTTPFRFLKRISRKWYLPGFEGLSVYDVGSFFINHAKWPSLTERAAAISYNFIMAIPPSMLFLFTIIPHLPFFRKKDITTQVHTLIFDIIPSKIYNQPILAFLDNLINDQRFGLMSFGILLALFFASNAMFGIMRSFNKEYLGFQRKKGLESRWVAIKLTLILFAIVASYFLLLIAQGAFLEWITKDKALRKTISYSRWIFIFAAVFYAIGLIFRYAPSVKQRWKIVSPGSIVATLLSVGATYGFSRYVENFGRYNALYGTIGTIMMIMALIYLNSLALLIGFELNVSITSLKEMADMKEREEKWKAPAVG